jgi:7tm Chemosensory receptor
MKAAGIDQKPRKLYFLTFSTIFGNVLMIFVLFVSLHILSGDLSKEYGLSNVLKIMFTYNSLAYQSYTIIYMIIIYLIYSRLSFITDFLKTMKYDSKKDHVLKELKVVADLIDEVCDALKSIKFCYTINTVIYTLHYSFYTILSIYGVISFLLRRNASEFDRKYVLLNLTWNAFYAPFAIWVFLMSNWIKKSGKIIEIEIHRVLSKVRHDEKIHKKAQLIFMQLYHRRPIISCGVFTIDWYFLFHLIGLSFSYLVIIIQFELKTFND